MTKDELSEITTSVVDAVCRKQSKDNDKSKLVDWLFKALIAVIVWIGVGLRDDVDVLKTDVSKITTQRTYSDRDMEDFKEFIKAPRFTKEDFINAIYPLKESVDRNTLELKSRSSFISNTETRLLKLEYEIKELKLK